jgi:lipoic acid synthetase
MTHIKKPAWLKVPPPWGESFSQTRKILNEYGLETVCKNANCPNIGECFGSGTATFLIMGNVCTRNCRFCNIEGGKPSPLDKAEPGKIAKAVQLMKLSYAVVTSVTRDDLPDGGASHFAQTIQEIKISNPGCGIEVLVPDFQGNMDSVRLVLDAEPDVFNHNVETVPRLYPLMRPAADYQRSLDVLKYAASEKQGIPVKSGIMVGAGEAIDEIHKVFKDLKNSGVSILTIGQYLPPSRNHHPLDRYYAPEEFADLKIKAIEAGIGKVISSPLARSSYHAKDIISGTAK